MTKNILITGGARGIGAATALLAARNGYAVCINYVRNHTAAHGVVESIIKGGGRAIAVTGDVSLEADVMKIFKAVDDGLGPLHALVNNAGAVAPQSRLEHMDAARMTRIFAINTLGALMCSREAVKRMSMRHGGTGGAIVNLSTALTRTGAPNMYIDYAASKAAIEAMTVGLAREVAGEGIRVNAVRPGLIDTDIHAEGGDPDRASKAKNFVPMGRAGEAEEVARAIMWLLSDQASYSTGTFIDVSGGV